MSVVKSKFESDAERFSEFCICSFDEAWAVIGLCRDYAFNEEKQYWENINEAIRIRQSYSPNEGMAGITQLIREAFEAHK